MNLLKRKLNFQLNLIHYRSIINLFSTGFSKHSNEIFDIVKAFEFLEISHTSTPEQCRTAYLNKVRQLHPDVQFNSNYSSSIINSKFYQLQEAYQIAYKYAIDYSKDNSQNNSNEQITISNHNAPQHRQFLDLGSKSTELHLKLDGLNISKRHKQVQMERVIQVNQTVVNHRINQIKNSLTEQKQNMDANSDQLIVKPKIRKSQHSTSINYSERIAEQLIQEAIDRGEFDDLSGQGRPLGLDRPEYVFIDTSTYRLSQILANQGYLPKWIELGKEIRTKWNEQLHKFVKVYKTMNGKSLIERNKVYQNFEQEVGKLNKLIDQYNLLVPVHHLQRCHLNAKTEIDQFLKCEGMKPTQPNNKDTQESDENGTTIKKSNQNTNDDEDKRNGNLWDPKYLAEIMRDFYRELARAYVSIIKGFKDQQ